MKKILKKIIKKSNILMCLYRGYLSIKRMCSPTKRIHSLQDLPANTSVKINVIYQHEKTLFYSPPVFDNFSEQTGRFLNGNKYLQYALHIVDAVVLGGSNLIITSANTILYDLPFYDNSKRYRYTDEKIVKFKDYKQITYMQGRKKKLDKAVWMGGNYSFNYYHLLFEFAIKFLYLNKMDIPMNIPVLIDEICFKIPQYNDLINIVNDKKYQLVPAKKTCRYKVNDLYYVNCPHFIPPNFVNENMIKADDVQFDPVALIDLRNFLLPHASERKFPERIFISRKNVNSGRRRFNEDQIIELCVQFGFEIIRPEELSFRDQIALFNQAKYIIGGSGAAFANLLFCRNHSKAIILAKNCLPFSGFSSIAYVSGVDLRYMTEEATKKRNKSVNIHDEFEIDINYLRKQIIEWIK